MGFRSRCNLIWTCGCEFLSAIVALRHQLNYHSSPLLLCSDVSFPAFEEVGVFSLNYTCVSLSFTSSINLRSHLLLLSRLKLPACWCSPCVLKQFLETKIDKLNKKKGEREVFQGPVAHNELSLSDPWISFSTWWIDTTGTQNLCPDSITWFIFG